MKCSHCKGIILKTHAFYTSGNNYYHIGCQRGVSTTSHDLQVPILKEIQNQIDINNDILKREVTGVSMTTDDVLDIVEELKHAG